MVNYEFDCPTHGTFEVYKPMACCGEPESCPQCGEIAQRLISMPAIKVVNKKRLKYGSGSPGKVLSHKETGGLDIFIPSDGALEQEEMDYIAEGAIEKERDRVKRKKGPQSETAARIEAYAQLAQATPQGQRAKVLRQAIADTGDRLVKTG